MSELGESLLSRRGEENLQDLEDGNAASRLNLSMRSLSELSALSVNAKTKCCGPGLGMNTNSCGGKIFTRVCMLGSVVLNLLLLGILYMYVRNNESFEPIKPPTPGNSTHHACPFSAYGSDVTLNADSIDTNDNRKYAAVTDVGPRHITLCWQPISSVVRSASVEPYQVEIDDWWTAEPSKGSNSKHWDPFHRKKKNTTRTKKKVIYSGRALHLNITDLLPATLYNIQVKFNGVGIKTDLAVTTGETEYCGNAQDVAAYKKTKKTMKGDIQSCMIHHFLSDSAAQKCIEKNVGLSSQCAACWLAEGHCTLEHCASACLNPASNACKVCSERSCFPSAVQCSGMPLWSFPP